MSYNELDALNEGEVNAGFGARSFLWLKTIYGASKEVEAGTASPSNLFVNNHAYKELTVTVIDWRLKIPAYTKKQNGEDTHATLVVARNPERPIATIFTDANYLAYMAYCENKEWQTRADKTVLLWVEEEQQFVCMDMKQFAKNNFNALVNASNEGGAFLQVKIHTAKNESMAKKKITVWDIKTISLGTVSPTLPKTEEIADAVDAFRSRDNLADIMEALNETPTA